MQLAPARRRGKQRADEEKPSSKDEGKRSAKLPRDKLLTYIQHRRRV